MWLTKPSRIEANIVEERMYERDDDAFTWSQKQL